MRSDSGGKNTGSLDKEGEQEPIPVDTHFSLSLYSACPLRLLHLAALKRTDLTLVFMEPWGTGTSIQTFPAGYSFISKLRQGGSNHEKEIEKLEGEI